MGAGKGKTEDDHICGRHIVYYGGGERKAAYAIEVGLGSGCCLGI